MVLPRLPTALAVSVCFATLLAQGALAEGPDLEAGKALADKHCGHCHAIGPVGSSRLPAAPPFRDIADRYSVWNLEEALAEGIVTGHAEMPQFVFTPAQITNLLGYMETLGKKKPMTK